MSKRILLQLAILSLALTWVIGNVTFPKAGYLLFTLFLTLYLAIGFSRPPRLICTYLVVIFSTLVLQILFLPIDWEPASLAIAGCFFTPLLTGSITLNYRDLASVLNVFKLITPFYFVGLLLQLAGVSNNFLVLEQTITLGEIHARYTSFSGGCLLLGVFSLIAILVVLSEYLEAKSPTQKLVLLVVFSMAVINLYFTYTRRYYVLFLLAITYFAYLIVSQKRGKKLFLLLALAAIIGVVASEIFSTISISGRLLSSIDLDEPGNELRVFLWLHALDIITANPWLGLGIGSEGSIGKSAEQVSENLVDGPMAESYFLRMGVDFGAVVALFFVVWIVIAIRASWTPGTKGLFLLRAIPALCAIESLFGTGLVSPYLGFIFWLVITQALRLQQADLRASRLIKQPDIVANIGIPVDSTQA